MSKKGQIFYSESKLKFYLRNSHSTHPCQIYLVASIDGKRYRIYTKMKVYASQWDSERQLAVISNVQSKQDNRNNKIANNYLNKLRGYFSEFIEYICNNNVDNIAETLKQFINRDMAKKKINLVYVVADALEYYHNYVKPSIKDSTKRQSESLLSEFGRFVDTLREKDKTMQIFSQRGLNMYKEYLIDKMNKSKEDDSKRNFGVGQLNRCGAIIALLINKVLVPQEKVPSPVVWIKVEDPRREDQMGHIPLLDNEVAAIESCPSLTPVEEEYRDVFLLHLECGQRVSDLAKLLTGNYKVKQGKKYKYIVVSTTKENIKAIIPITPKVTMLMEKIKNHTLVDPKEFEEKTKGKGNNTYNEAIRRIAKKAGLDREIVKIDSTQKEVRKPLYKTISSHDARCTFITNMIKKGVSPERLCRMTGHANDEMIKRVYAQLTIEDEINRIESDLWSDIEEETPIETGTRSASSFLEERAVKTEETPKSPVNCIEDDGSAEEFDTENYLKGLNSIIDKAISQDESQFSEFGLGLPDSIISDFELSLAAMRNELNENELNTEEDVICFWKGKEEEFQQNEKSSSQIEFDKLCYLHALIDYSKNKQFGSELMDTLNGLLNDICKNNPLIKISYSLVPLLSSLSCLSVIIKACSETTYYITYNRPYLDDLFDFDSSPLLLNRVPDWKLVYMELQKLPKMRINSFIQHTNCPYDIKIKLYNSIVSQDEELFGQIIQQYEREAYTVIELAYTMDMADKMKQYIEEKDRTNADNTNPEEKMDNSIINNLSMNPFQNFNPNMIFNYLNDEDFDPNEFIFGVMEMCFRQIKKLKDHAFPSEAIAINRIMEYIDQFPKTKAAYEEYIIKSDSPSDSKPLDQNNKSECSFEKLNIFKTNIDYSKYNPNELLSTLNDGITRRGDDVFKEFINFLANSSCIDNNDEIKQLLVYRFTGRCRPANLEKIPWNPDKLNELAYVIMYSTARANGKYEKVREFFEGPRFPADISMIRTTANNAPKDFRAKLNDLYPDVFTYKG